jgi:uncharacterized membrane protein HdeD (DUF308 family)
MARQIADSKQIANENRLKRYYYIRSVFSIAWVVAAFTIAKNSPGATAVLVVTYAAWDALSNYVDGQRDGGLSRNPTQLVNVFVSLVVALALVLALPDMHQVLSVFGVWAILSGLLQLGTAIRRWKTAGGQWTMILSGLQSAAAGAFFIQQARLPAIPTIETIAGYAGFGAIYFLLAALLLSLKHWRLRTATSRY